MEWYWILLLSLGGAALLLLGIWLFLIAPHARKKAMHPFLRPYAHRGLWGGDIPENSLAAFARAAELGFAIELDVQLSSDGVVMVFHDYTLKRVCAREGKLSDFTADTLQGFALSGSTQTIPTLRQVLETVGGRVPLLIELKGESGDTALVPPLLALLREYNGPYCIESFNPLLLRAVRKQAPDLVCGLLSSDLIKEKRPGSPLLNFALSALLTTFLCRPAFHAWDMRHPRRLALWLGIHLFGAASLVFTVRDPQDFANFMAQGVFPIFEGFVPQERHA